MAMFRIYDYHAYPSEIRDIRTKLLSLPEPTKIELKESEFLIDYINDAKWHPCSDVGSLRYELRQILINHEIIVFHNTRQLTAENILSEGLIFSGQRYLGHLIDAMIDANIDEQLRGEVIQFVEHEIQRHGTDKKNTRRDEVCFFFDLIHYKEFDKYLAVFGGEFVEFALSIHADKNRSLIKFKDVMKIGKPYIVEFSVPILWLRDFYVQDIACHMIESWVCHDLRNKEVPYIHDCRIEKEIPSSKIIAVHSMRDEFPEIDEYFFRDS